MIGFVSLEMMFVQERVNNMLSREREHSEIVSTTNLVKMKMNGYKMSHTIKIHLILLWIILTNIYSTQNICKNRYLSFSLYHFFSAD